MAGQNTMEFKDDTFEKDVLEAKEPVLVDFWAEWCMPCKALGPTIDELANEYAGKVKIGKMNTESNNSTPIKYGITAIPTILLFNHGQVIQKFVGLKQKSEFKEAIDKVAG